MTDNQTHPHQTGGCQCGDIRYEISGDPIALYICHCRECQKQSSSAFGISMLVKSENFRILSGKPKVWTRVAKLAGSLDCAFCPVCGSRVWHGDLAKGDTISVKGGTLDNVPSLENVPHFWTCRKLPGIIIPENSQTYPENYEG